MKSLFTGLFIFILALLASCGGGKKAVTTASFSSTFALTANDIEIVIVGKNLTTNRSFTKMFTGPLSLELENGNWEFNMITWEVGANGPYTGNNRCGTTTKLLDGGYVTISFTVDANGCIAMGDAAYKNAGDFHAFYLQGCTDFSGLSGYGSTCGTNGPAYSYSVAVVPYDYSSIGAFAYRHDKLIPSNCLSANMIKFPVRTSFPFPIVIRAHANSNCTPRVDDQIYLYTNGLDNNFRSQIETTGTTSKVFLRNLIPAPNTVATIPGIAPASFNEDTESIITLAYLDLEGDLANACAVTALTSVALTKPCACDGAGVCTVGLTGTANFNGSASFQYKVETNSQWSPYSSNITLTIDPVNDPPLLSYVGDVSIASGSTSPAYFNISDPDGDAINCAGAIIIPASTVILPLVNISIPTGGAGPLCTFNVTPNMGVTNVSVSLLDPGGAVGSMVFNVTGF